MYLFYFVEKEWRIVEILCQPGDLKIVAVMKHPCAESQAHVMPVLLCHGREQTNSQLFATYCYKSYFHRKFDVWALVYLKTIAAFCKCCDKFGDKLRNFIISFDCHLS